MSEEILDDKIEFEVETIMLPLEDGTDLECAILDEFEFNGNKYMAMAPIEEGDTLGEETYLYRFKEIGDEIEFEYIEDDAELNAVGEAYETFLNSLEGEQ